MFYIFVGFQNASDNVFHGFGSFALYFWKSFGDIFEGVYANPAKRLLYFACFKHRILILQEVAIKIQLIVHSNYNLFRSAKCRSYALFFGGH